MTVKPSEKSFLPVEEKRIPLNIATLISYLKDEGHQVTFVDNYLKNNDWENIVEDVSPDYLGLYLSFESWANAKKYLEILNLMRTDEPKLEFKLVVFGPCATFNAEYLPDYVDYVIVDNVEHAFLELTNDKVDQKLLSGKSIEKIDSLKRPDWKFFIPDNNPYDSEYDLTDVVMGDVFPVFEMLTTYGCQHTLKYCPVSAMACCSSRVLSPLKIVENIKYLVSTFDAKAIKFKDYNFVDNKERLMSFCAELKATNLGINWYCSVKPGSADREMLSVMKDSGCCGIMIPVESGSQTILDYINADFKVKQVKELFAISKEINLKTTASVCYGIPNETEFDRNETENLLEECKPDYTRIRIFVGLPKSELSKEALNYSHRIDDNGLIIPSQWEALAKKYLGKTNYSGSYIDVPIASNPLSSVVFYKKREYIDEKVTFINSLPRNKKLYFYGAGKLAKSFLKKYKMEDSNARGFIDNDLSKSGRLRPTKFTVYHETEIKKLAPDYIFLTMASKEDSFKVKKAIINNIDIDKKPEICSMFYEEI